MHTQQCLHRAEGTLKMLIRAALLKVEREDEFMYAHYEQTGKRALLKCGYAALLKVER